MSVRGATALLLCLAAFGCLATLATAALESRGSYLEMFTADRFVSPAAGTSAQVEFRLRDGADAHLQLRANGGGVVRDLEPVTRANAGLMRFEWDGRTGRDTPAPPGRYQLVIVPDDRSEIPLPSYIRVDSRAPDITCAFRDDRRVLENGVIRLHAAADEPVYWAVTGPGGPLVVTAPDGVPDGGRAARPAAQLDVVKVRRGSAQVRDSAFPMCDDTVIVLQLVDDPAQPGDAARQRQQLLDAPIVLRATDRAGNQTALEPLRERDARVDVIIE